MSRKPSLNSNPFKVGSFRATAFALDQARINSSHSGVAGPGEIPMEPPSKPRPSQQSLPDQQPISDPSRQNVLPLAPASVSSSRQRRCIHSLLDDVVRGPDGDIETDDESMGDIQIPTKKSRVFPDMTGAASVRGYRVEGGKAEAGAEKGVGKGDAEGSLLGGAVKDSIAKSDAKGSVAHREIAERRVAAGEAPKEAAVEGQVGAKGSEEEIMAFQRRNLKNLYRSMDNTRVLIEYLDLDRLTNDDIEAITEHLERTNSDWTVDLANFRFMLERTANRKGKGRAE
ncbi:uncharacterized protein I303_107876 [Kwoniella dejecticola CBS 10117]|uniref:Uncharacterized protein n=1 Tax=Kwoniella dejecticola CBS 10117 TaxID=1296121 RepID=A0A1A5ZVX8_9TREE|nr:uncharacterized protein I303_07879 [Kwoniella dejecticola CBS 10117]OBR81966.1 hypothetical protein I303_07879 [Kwoniella dejecticola CBS 10117]